MALDRSGLHSESNELRYRPVSGVVVRSGPETPADDVRSLRAAAGVAGVPVVVSAPAGELADVAEDDAGLASRIARSGAERLRLLVPVAEEVLVACHEAGVAVDTTPVTHHGRLELPCWLREQAVSWTRHRHGRITAGRTHRRRR